jgi:hypothetical protein
MAMPTPLRFYAAILSGVPGWTVRLGTFLYFLPYGSDALQRQDDQTYKLSGRYYNSQGTHLSDVQYDLVIKSGSGWHEQCGGWGAADPGYWKPGTYRLQILIDGIEFAEGSFVIE